MPKVANRDALAQKVLELAKKQPRPSVQAMADRVGKSPSFVKQVLREAGKETGQEAAAPREDAQGQEANPPTPAAPQRAPVAAPLELVDEAPKPRGRAGKKPEPAQVETPAEEPAGEPAAAAEETAGAPQGGVRHVVLS